FFTQPDIAERSSRPYLEGRVRARWGSGDTQGEINLGGHLGWLAVGPDRRITSRAAAVSVWTPVGRGLELRGEAYTGRALAGLGGDVGNRGERLVIRRRQLVARHAGLYALQDHLRHPGREPELTDVVLRGRVHLQDALQQPGQLQRVLDMGRDHRLGGARAGH